MSSMERAMSAGPQVRDAVPGRSGGMLHSKTGVIAWITTKETVRQPIFLLLALLGGLFLVVSIFLPYFTFGEDIKMVKDVGLVAMLVCGLILAIFSSSTSIAEDIEHRTAITLLSKPINRRQFIVGKFLGITVGTALMFLFLSVIFLALVYYKVGYDARESAKERPPSAQCWDEVYLIIPGIVLTFFQAVVLTALSVAISTRLPMVVNIVTCVSIFFLGHLGPILVSAAHSSEGGILASKMVLFTAQMVEVILPALEFFNVGPAISTGSSIPLSYVLWNLVYCILYSTAGLLLAFVLFEDRDLA